MGAPPREEVFANLSEQLESAMQLMRWLEEKFTGDTDQIAFAEARERMRALVVVRDVQSLLQESKAIADAEAGLDIPKAPKLPRV
jgi:hypothetical protein